MVITKFYLPLICLVVLMHASAVRAQGQDVPDRDPEERFGEMRDEAVSGHYARAREIGWDLLGSHPGYFDAVLYLARIYGWEGKFDSAYALLGPLPEDPGAKMEAFATLIDLAYWENDWRKMAAYASEAMALAPDSAIFRENTCWPGNRLPPGKPFRRSSRGIPSTTSGTPIAATGIWPPWEG